MAEVVALVASITGIAAFGGKLSMSLFQLATVVGGARDEVVCVGQEISLFSAVLSQIASSLDDPDCVRFSDEAVQTIQWIMGSCHTIFIEINDVLDGLKVAESKDTGKGGASTMKLTQRVKWMFQRHKIQLQRGALESMKLTLHLMLAMLDLSRRVQSRRTSVASATQLAEVADEDVVVDSLVAAHQLSLERLKELERLAEDTPLEEESANLETAAVVPAESSAVVTASASVVPSTSGGGGDGNRSLVWATGLGGKTRSSEVLYEAVAISVIPTSLVSETNPDEGLGRPGSANPCLLSGKWTTVTTMAPAHQTRGSYQPQEPRGVRHEMISVQRGPRGMPSRKPLRPVVNGTSEGTWATAASERAKEKGKQTAPAPEPRNPPTERKDAQVKRTAPPHHAVERWEALSVHWEGLTSLWIRQLQQRREEIGRNPIAEELARKVQDLSAAGANLFHAVVEMQRLRASSERKFQRWFFETRGELERYAEANAILETALEEERSRRPTMIASDAGRGQTLVAADEALRALQSVVAEGRSAYGALKADLEKEREVAEEERRGRLELQGQLEREVRRMNEERLGRARLQGQLEEEARKRDEERGRTAKVQKELGLEQENLAEERRARTELESALKKERERLAQERKSREQMQGELHAERERRLDALRLLAG